MNYLPSKTFKERYQNAKEALSTNMTNEGKMGNIRPLVEVFINDCNNVVEDNKIREAIKKLEDDLLSSALHKIVDDTLIGVHIKDNKLKNDPKYVMEVLDTIFIKNYVLPVKEKKLQEEFDIKKTEIENIYQTQLQNIQ